MTYAELVNGLIEKLGQRRSHFYPDEAGLEITGYLEPELAPLAAQIDGLSVGWIKSDCEITDEMVIHLINDLMRQGDALRGEMHRLRQLIPRPAIDEPTKLALENWDRATQRR